MAELPTEIETLRDSNECVTDVDVETIMETPERTVRMYTLRIEDGAKRRGEEKGNVILQLTGESGHVMLIETINGNRRSLRLVRIYYRWAGKTVSRGRNSVRWSDVNRALSLYNI